MVQVTSGGQTFSLNYNLKKNLDIVKDAVLHKDFDYICVVSGICGSGKSTFAQQICKYLDSTFNTKDRICFSGTGENGLIERATNSISGKAFMLDESFQDLNTKISMSPDFVAIMSFLQLIRQRGLFIVLCLPNFFDLSKGIALFRANHLFVIRVGENYTRGNFEAFDRFEKQRLYVLGSKFMDYNCGNSNFDGSFSKKWVVDLKLYEKLKLEHLLSQKTRQGKRLQRDTYIRNTLIKYLHDEDNLLIKQISEITGLATRTIHRILF